MSNLRVVTTYPKYQVCPVCQHKGRFERVLTSWERDGEEVTFPGTHQCSKGHLFVTQLEVTPGEQTFEVT